MPGRCGRSACSEPVDEPGGLDVLPDGRLVVADTNHHRVITVDIATGAVIEIHVRDVAAQQSSRPAPRSPDAPEPRCASTAMSTSAGSDLDSSRDRRCT